MAVTEDSGVCNPDFGGHSTKSTALQRTTIPLMELVKQLKAHGIKVGYTKPKVHCEVFDDNTRAIEIAQVPKMRPRTKHINIKYFHFCDYVERGEIAISKIATEDQPSDILTKPVNETILNRHSGFIMGWRGRSRH
jgi:hypothetical protein